MRQHGSACTEGGQVTEPGWGPGYGRAAVGTRSRSSCWTFAVRWTLSSGIRSISLSLCSLARHVIFSHSQMRPPKLPTLLWVAQSCSTAREVEMWSQCYPAPKEPSGFLYLRGGSLSTQKNRLLKATENIKFEKRTDMGFRAWSWNEWQIAPLIHPLISLNVTFLIHGTPTFPLGVAVEAKREGERDS